MEVGYVIIVRVPIYVMNMIIAYGDFSMIILPNIPMHKVRFTVISARLLIVSDAVKALVLIVDNFNLRGLVQVARSLSCGSFAQ